MYIQPNSDIKILKNIPFDNSYTDTMYFATSTEQYNYFNGFTKYNLTSQYYARVNDGVLKVERPIQDVQDCNYLMFRNNSFGAKWFYAFITSVEYINNVTSRITFELDLMQTYFFDVVLKECFVEREHDRTDNIGDNLQPENFKIDDYVYQNFNVLKDGMDELVTILAFGHNYEWTDGYQYAFNIVDNVVQGARFFAYTQTSIGKLALASAISRINSNNNLDEIIDIYAIPSFCLPANSPVNQANVYDISNAIPDQSSGYRDAISVAKPTAGSTLIDIKGGTDAQYTPKNNKLYTYPFYSLELSNSIGQKAIYAFEDFSGNNASIGLVASMTNPVQVSAYPRNFKRPIPTTNLALNSEGCIGVANYPKSTCIGDAYKAWSAQNSVPMVVDTLMSAVVGGLAGAMIGSSGGALALAGSGGIDPVILGGLVSGGMKTKDNLMSAYKAEKTSDSTHGSINSGNAFHAVGLNTITYAHRHIPNQMARVVDDYFTMYGYACNQVKYPNRAVRTRFTYTKTRGCNMRGSCPADDIKRINSIYDNGIRFWMSTATVGDFSTPNPPIGA